VFFVFAILLLSACNSASPELGEEKSVEEIASDGKISNSDIIRNPVSSDNSVDTVNVAKMTFEEEVYDFGEVNQGDVVEHVFKFTNTGKIPLLISTARSTCGCTVPEWPKELIDPGEGGEIKVKFDTRGKANDQQKPVTIRANTYPMTNKVMLKGFVKTSDNS
jgi:hypothetical protein